MLEIYGEFVKWWEELSEMKDYYKKSTRVLEKTEMQTVERACSKASDLFASYKSAVKKLEQAKSPQEKDKARNKLKNEALIGMERRVVKWAEDPVICSAVEKHHKKLKVS